MKKYFSNLAIMNFIESLENAYPVDEWKIGKIYFWPIIRNDLPYLLQQRDEVPDDNINKNSKDIRFLKYTLSCFFKKTRDHLTSCVTCFFKTAKIFIQVFSKGKNFRYILISNGISKIDIGKARVDKFIYPYIREFGLESCLCFEKALHKNNQSTQFMQLYYLERMSYYIARTFWFLPMKVSCQKFNLFVDKIKKEVPTKHLTIKSLKTNVLQINILSYFFDCLIKQLGISEGYIVTYNDFIGYALANACQKNSILCFDIEHGSIINCPNYVGWKKVPREGYSILPKGYVLWDSFIKEYFIKNNSRNFTNFLNFKTDGLKIISYSEGSPKARKKIDSAKRQYKMVVLVTLQTQFYGLNDWSMLASVISENNNTFWIIRSHPTKAHFKGLEPMLKLKTQKNVLFDDDEFNIYDLLKKVDCHITTASASALEAFIFGVKTIFISVVGLENFSYLIENKKAFYASNKDELNNLLNIISQQKIEQLSERRTVRKI